MISLLTVKSALAALRVVHESLGRPSAHFSVETQREAQAEIRAAIAELEAYEPQEEEQDVGNEG